MIKKTFLRKYLLSLFLVQVITMNVGYRFYFTHKYFKTLLFLCYQIRMVWFMSC